MEDRKKTCFVRHDDQYLFLFQQITDKAVYETNFFSLDSNGLLKQIVNWVCQHINLFQCLSLI